MPELTVGERVDPDAIARRVDAADPAHASLASGREALARIARALEAARDLTVETTLSGRQPLDLMQRARDRGYHVSLIFVGTADPKLNIERVRRRISAGGHAIADDDVRRRFDRSLANLPRATALADAVAVFDNSGEPRQLRVVYDRDEGREHLVADAPRWLTAQGTLPRPELPTRP